MYQIYPVLAGKKNQPLMIGGVGHPKCLATVTVEGKTRLACAARDENGLYIIDAATMKPIFPNSRFITLPGKAQPAAVAVADNRWVCVSTPGTGWIHAYEVTTGKPYASLELNNSGARGGDPKFMAAFGTLLLAPLHDRQSMAVLNLTERRLQFVHLGDQPMDVAVDELTEIAYIPLAGEHQIATMDTVSLGLKTPLTLEEYPDAIFQAVSFDPNSNKLWALFSSGNVPVDRCAIFDVDNNDAYTIFDVEGLGWTVGQRIFDAEGNLIVAGEDALHLFTPDGLQFRLREYPDDAQPYGLVADPLDPQVIYVGVKGADKIEALRLVPEREKVAA